MSVLPLGRADGAAVPVSRIAAGEALRPPSPCCLEARILPGGEIELSWVRRSQLGFGWVAGEVPLGEAAIAFDVKLGGSAGSLELVDVTSPLIVGTDDRALIGSGAANASIVMRGDRAASRASTIHFNN